MEAACVAEHYDDLDRFYRDVWGEHVHHGLWERGDETVAKATDGLAAKVVEALDAHRGDHVVDIGCGYGATARMLAEKAGARVEGWTVSRAQWEVATGEGGARYRCEDWMENRLRDGEVDGAISIECLSHVGEKGRFFREVERVLKPGGRFVLCCWMLGSGRIAGLVEGAVCRGGRFAGIWTEEAILDSGMDVEVFEDLTVRVRRTWPVIVGRVLGRMLTVPDYRKRFLWGAGKREWLLAWTVLMTMVGFYGGGLSYGFFVFQKRC